MFESMEIRKRDYLVAPCTRMLPGKNQVMENTLISLESHLAFPNLTFERRVIMDLFTLSPNGCIRFMTVREQRLLAVS